MKKISEKTKEILKKIGRSLLSIIGIKWPKVEKAGNDIIDILKVPVPDDPQEADMAVAPKDFEEKNENELKPVIKDIPGTPFKLVNPGTGNLFSLCWGPNILCMRQFTSTKEAKDYLSEHTWEIITIVSTITHNYLNNIKISDK